MSHTEGEWKYASATKKSPAYVYAEWRDAQNRRCKWVICEVGSHPEHDAQANAQLIAAAPKMYKKGKILFNLLQGAVLDCRESEALHDFGIAIAEAEVK